MALGSVLVDFFFNNLAICISALLVSPFVSTWLLCKFVDRRGKPPLVPHFIPFVGHGWGMAFYANEFISKIRKQYPHSDAVSITVFGLEFHLIFDPKLCASVHRQGKIMTFDAVSIMVNTAFGTPKHDIDVLHLHVPSSIHSSSIEDDGRRVTSEMNRRLTGDLTGDNLAEMMVVFMETLQRNIEKEFPANSVSGDWVTLDFCEFTKRHLTSAAIPSMYGPHLMKIWPQIHEDIWSFDDDLKVLTKGAPKFLYPNIYKKRERMLNTIIEWEKNALENRDIQKLTEENPAWDEYWGARIVRNRYNILVKNGIGDVARAAQYLGLIYGQNINSIPVAIWLLIHCFLDLDLGQRVRTLLASYRNQDGTYDLPGIMTDSFLKSFFLEALRMTVAAPTVRLATEPTTIGPYRVDFGDTVMVPGRELQLDAAVWSPDEKTTAPCVFQADRFVSPDDSGKPNDKQEEEGKKSTSGTSGNKSLMDPMALPASTSAEIRERMQSMRPFGGGTHYCPGRQFSVQEAVVGMIMMLVNFEVEVDEEALKRIGKPQVRLSDAGSMQPDRKFMVRIRRRREGNGKA